MKQIRTPISGTPIALPGATQPRGSAQDMPLHPADELAHIRAELRRLHAREDELKRHYREDASDADLTGATFEVSVMRHAKRVFDPSLLPQAILSNPRFYRAQATTLVTTTPKAPKIPFQALLPGMVASEEDEAEDFDLIEMLPN
ncbi:hypothetical protein [Aliiroseovarius marinus]|uniref:hypothetical protein n=1 Tax=Aliiroseovarius marinus TaxID=2500159 RepID=UPI003D7EA27C